MLRSSPFYAMLQLKTPAGLVSVHSEKGCVTAVYFTSERESGPAPSAVEREAARQIEAYFAKELRKFDLPCRLLFHGGGRGTVFPFGREIDGGDAPPFGVNGNKSRRCFQLKHRIKKGKLRSGAPEPGCGKVTSREL